MMSPAVARTHGPNGPMSLAFDPMTEAFRRYGSAAPPDRRPGCHGRFATGPTTL
jgi:hypothetical protein